MLRLTDSLRQRFGLVCGLIVLLGAGTGCPLDVGEEPCTDDGECTEVYGFGAVCGEAGYCEVEGDGRPVGGDSAGDGVGVLVDGVSPTTVRTIGIAAQTGTTRDLGIGMTVGIQAAFAGIGDEGPIRFQHFARDDGYVPDNSVQLFEEVTNGGGLRDDPEPNGGAEAIEGRQAFAVIGSMGSPTSLRMLDSVNDAGHIFFGTYSGASHLYREIPDEVVWQYRPRYEDEAYDLANFLMNRNPRPVAPRNVFAFSQSPVEGDPCASCDGSSGVSGGAEEATSPEQTVMDAYGFSGYRGIRRALEERNINVAEIPMGTYRANSLDVSAGVNYFVRWVADDSLVTGAHRPDIPEVGAFEVGVVMIPVGLPGAEFVTELISEVERMRAGDKPNAITLDEWDELPDANKEHMRRVAVTFTSISPAGDVMAQTLAADNAERFCGPFDIVVSQVVPFPTGGSQAANNYRDDLAAAFPSEQPGFVTFEGWAVGKIWAAVINQTLERGDEITTDNVLETMRGFSEEDVGVGALIDWGPNDHQGSNQIFGSRINAQCVYESFELNG